MAKIQTQRRTIAVAMFAVALVVMGITTASTTPRDVVEAAKDWQDVAVMERARLLQRQEAMKPVNEEVQATEGSSGSHVGYFLRSMQTNASGTIAAASSSSSSSDATVDLSWLEGFAHYRLLPGYFPNGMKYHFDGLATVLRMEFNNADRTNQDGAAAPSVSYFARPFESTAYEEYDSHKCLFFGTGTGPTLGPPTNVCFRNPGVNLLPIDGQLWLTIDTSKWGRVDLHTLETHKDSKPDVASFVLNAHPACDRSDPNNQVCYVQHPCPPKASPYAKDVCFSTLHALPGNGSNLNTTIISRASMEKAKIIQHSHSPCVTPNYVVSKLDAFTLRNPINGHGGLLKFAHQGEDNQWLVMDRRDNTSTIMKSSHSFVNNHFWNCGEDSDGNIVVESVAATEDYLDNYFETNLNKSTASWSTLFHEPLRCIVEPASNKTIQCGPLVNESGLLFDYPTFNPHFKMNADYRFFYGIAPIDTSTSRWFDRVVKIDRLSGKVAAQFSADGLYMTEADFIPRTSNTAAESEDDGVLLTIVYNNTSDKSSIVILDATDLKLLATYPFGFALPFHAHGISCAPDLPCWTNP